MKRKIITFFIIMMTLIPTLTNAEENKYEITKFNKTVSTDSNGYTYSSYEYQKIIGETEDYFYISGNGALYRVDKETLKEKSTLYGSNYSGFKMADDRLYRVRSTNSSGQYSMYIETYDLNIENLNKINIEYKTTKSFSIYSSVFYNNKYYILYNVGYTTNPTYQLMIVSEDGTDSDIIDLTNVKGTSTELKIFNNTLYLVEVVNSSPNFYTNIYTLSNSGTLELKTKLENMVSIEVNYANNEFMVLGTKYDGTNAEGANIQILNNKFEIIKEKNISDKITNIYYLSNHIVSNNDEYIVFDDSELKLYVYSNDLSTSYEVNCNQSLLSSSVYYGPFIYDNSLYIVGGYGIQSYSSERGGNFIIKLEQPVIEQDYTIKTEVIAGKGTIEASATKSKANEKITYKATPAENYETKSIKVITENNVEIKPTDNSFTMPEDNVIIQVEFVTKEIIEDEKNEDIKGETDKKEENPETFGGVSIIIITSLIISGLILVLLQKSKYYISNL